MNGIYYGFFTIRLFIYITLIFLIEYFFILYKLNDTDVNRLIFYILGFEFIIAGMMVSYSVLLNLRKTTVHTLYISLGRFTVEIILIYFLLFEYGVLAAALILLLSRYFETFVAYFFINNEKVFKFTFLTIILAIPCVMYFVSEALN